MPYDIDTCTADCYEGTSCLINKFDIRDEKTLAKVEAEITFARIAVLENEPINGLFDTAHYKAIHKFLFEDLYDWAGRFREIDISKKGTLFADHDKLDTLCDKLFSRIRKLDHFKGMPYDRFIDEIVDVYCSLNHIHPFREGNGRTQRVFLTQLIRNCGYSINFSDIDADLLMIATIHSSQGVTDHLREIFTESITIQ